MRTPQAVACINVLSLQHNLKQVRQFAPDAKILAVIKANGYGHGMETVANALLDADAFAVGTMQEALQLRSITKDKAIVVLQGIFDASDIQQCVAYNLQPVIHSEYQLELIETAKLDTPIRCWLKVDTGMHRLGIQPDQLTSMLGRIQQAANVDRPVTIMSHMACADDPAHVENQLQIETFDDLEVDEKLPRSLANSAAIIAFSGTHYDWVRPGIMLYGISPVQDRTASELGLQPAMTLKSRLIAIHQLMQGDCIGYGATWQCPEDMSIGVIGMGYGDGYPRHAPSGTPVLINGKRVPVVGRVSMDLITVDLRELPGAAVGDEVILWGEGLPIEEIADEAETIAYELVCRLTSRVEYQLVS
ncbi:MAG: alanine racemase [Gammaproteobacteria bacterium]|nr:alanine racemase [Gammaproteobacteria bacterium]